MKENNKQRVTAKEMLRHLYEVDVLYSRYDFSIHILTRIHNIHIYNPIPVRIIWPVLTTGLLYLQFEFHTHSLISAQLKLVMPIILCTPNPPSISFPTDRSKPVSLLQFVFIDSFMVSYVKGALTRYRKFTLVSAHAWNWMKFCTMVA